MSCLIPTLKIKELAAQFPNETVRSVTNLISSWQEDYNKSVEEIPSIEELKNYISEIRKSPLENSVSEKTINISTSINENADLSNFAIRPFMYKGIKYNTVEGAFQAEKLEYADASQSYNDKNISTNEYKQGFSELSGNLARQQGRSIKGLDRNAWDHNSSRIMKELITASFEQNPNALQRLLSTGNAELTHKFRGIEQDGGRFSKLLMEVRNELRDKYQQKTGISQERQQQIEELFKDNPELANAVYSSIGLNMINESEITYTDEEGNPCAKNGMRNSNFTKGSTWEIVQDLKGYPSHAQGGVDIKLGKDGFSFSKNNTIIKAEHGLVLPIN